MNQSNNGGPVSETDLDPNAHAPVTIKTPRPRGFAAISPERRSEIASKGGKAAHAAGTAHKFDSAEGQAAGRKGGVAPHASRGRKAGE